MPPIIVGTPVPLKSFVLSKLFGVYGSYGDSCKDGTSYVGVSGHLYCGAYFPETGVTSKFEFTVFFSMNTLIKLPFLNTAKNST